MKLSNRLRTTLIVISTISILLVMIYVVGPSELKKSILALSPAWIALFFLVYFLAYLVRSYRWQKLLNVEQKEISFSTAFRTLHLTYFVNSVTPARLGELARIYALKKEEKIPSGKSIANITVEHILDFIIILTYSAISILYLLHLREIPEKSYTVLGISFVFITLLILLAIFVIFFGDKFISKTKRISEKLYHKLTEVYQHFKEGMLTLSKKKAILTQTCLYTFIIWFFEILNIFIVAKAMGLDISLWICIYAGAIALLTLAVPILPGGFGSYEAVLSSLLVISGISLDKALTLALIDHGLRLIYLLSIGPPFMVKTGINLNKLKKEEKYQIESS